MLTKQIIKNKQLHTRNNIESEDWGGNSIMYLIPLSILSSVLYFSLIIFLIDRRTDEQMDGKSIYVPAMLWFVRNMHLVFIHSSWLTAPKIFGSDKSNGSIFCCNIWFRVLRSWKHFRVMNGKWVPCSSLQAPFHPSRVYVTEVAFGKHLRMGAGWVVRRTNHDQKVGTFSPTLDLHPWRLNQ